jgi:hypothetical protein
MLQPDRTMNLVSQRHLCRAVFRQSDSCEHIWRNYFCMSSETKDSVSGSPLRMTAVRGILPVWVGTPKCGREFFPLTYLVNANNITSDVYDRFRN